MEAAGVHCIVGGTEIWTYYLAAMQVWRRVDEVLLRLGVGVPLQEAKLLRAGSSICLEAHELGESVKARAGLKAQDTKRRRTAAITQEPSGREVKGDGWMND